MYVFAQSSLDLIDLPYACINLNAVCHRISIPHPILFLHSVHLSPLLGMALWLLFEMVVVHPSSQGLYVVMVKSGTVGFVVDVCWNMTSSLCIS